MEIVDVKNQIKSGKFDKVYVFHGPEHAVMKLYLKMMADKGNYQLTYVDSLMDLMTGVRTKALVPIHHLYVIMDDKEYLTNEKMWDKFNGLKDDIVVFYYSTTDKRLKFWKQNKDKAVEFTTLSDPILIKYIQKDIDLSEKNCLKLIELCESDYGRILLEIDKIKNYKWDADIVMNAYSNKYDMAFEELLKQGAIYRNPKDAIFDFVGAFLERKPSKAYDLLQQSKEVGEANLVLISVLYNNIKTLLQVQSAKDYKTLGINGFVLKNVLPYRDNYSNAELVKAMKLLREIEKGIKTGTIPDELSVEYFMVQIM